jgi:hypothetical protein
MKGFIASMTLVTAGVIVISTFNSGNKSVSVGNTSVRSVISEQSFTINQNPAPEEKTDLNHNNPTVRNTIISTTPALLAQKMDEKDEITVTTLDGRSMQINKYSINSMSPGIYIARYQNKVYRIVKK